MSDKRPSQQQTLGAPQTRSVRLSFWVLTACFLVIAVLLSLFTAPERHTLTVGDIAPKTITATKDVVDEVTTDLNRERAASSVQPVYREDELAMGEVMLKLEALFVAFEHVRAYGQAVREENGYIAGSLATFTRKELDLAADLCTDMVLSDWQLTILMRLSRVELSALLDTTKEAVVAALEATIRESGLDAAVTNIQRQINQSASSDLTWNVAVPAVRLSLIPNMVIHQEETEKKREQARHDVESVLYKNGQNILVAGERVTTAQITVLRELGLLEGNQFDLLTIAGICGISLLVLLMILSYILQFDRKRMAKHRRALMLSLILLITLVLNLITVRINPLLTTATLSLLLVATLLSPDMAIVANTAALLFAGILINAVDVQHPSQMLGIIVGGLLSAPIGIYILKTKQHRGTLMIAGLVMALINAAGMAAIGLLTNADVNLVVQSAVWLFGSTLLSTVIALGLQPLFESLFALVTPYKLMELSNPNQPLMRRLLLETPGTYHHSIMVANLCEAGAEAIGADPLLARVGAYYHDIGKLERPQYFKENQGDDNPHDRTDPRVSAAIIAEHVADGIKLAKQYHLPQAIIDFIPQHHGDTMIAYFYHKMKQMDDAGEVDCKDFRYPGPKPHTRETAILMMADTIEAAVRAGGDKDTEALNKQIHTLIRQKIDDEQMGDSPLRFVDISRIADAFTKVMAGVYHKRIEYPKMEHVLDGTSEERDAHDA